MITAAKAALWAAPALLLTGTARAQYACQGNTGPDVVIADMDSLQSYTAASGLDALSVETTLCNVGTAVIRWNASPANTHPVIAFGLYKYSTVNGAGRFEQIGQGWVKHAFFALTGSFCCGCQAPPPPNNNGTQLGVGCSDIYAAAQNGAQSNMGPKYQVNAHTGFFPAATPPRPPVNNVSGRLAALLTDLEPSSPSVLYYAEALAITPDETTDTNRNNNAAYRPLSVTLASASPLDYTFAIAGATVPTKPAIAAWKAADPAVTQTSVQVPGDGLFILSSRATSIGGGQWHYEFALYNMNGDRDAGSFSVPVPASTTLSNIGFHCPVYRDGDGEGGVNFSGTPWAAARSGGTLTWSTQAQSANINANAVRWGTTYNFRFDANAAPAANADTTIGLWKPGTPSSVSALAQVPAAPCIADVDDGSGTGHPDGGVTIDDLLYYLRIFAAGDIRADVDNGSGTGTRDGGVTIDDLLYYLARFTAGC